MKKIYFFVKTLIVMVILYFVTSKGSDIYAWSKTNQKVSASEVITQDNIQIEKSSSFKENTNKEHLRQNTKYNDYFLFDKENLVVTEEDKGVSFHFKNNSKEAFYSNIEGQEFFDIKIGGELNQLKAKKTMTKIQQGNIVYEMNTAKFDNKSTYKDPFLTEEDDYYVYYFVDIHKKNKIKGIYYISKEEDLKNGFYYSHDKTYQDLQEMIMLSLINSERKKEDIPTLKRNTDYYQVAYEHSKDMSKHNYFSHHSLNGSSFVDRLNKEKEIRKDEFKTVGENLAMGQRNIFFSHEGLMNSIGHRNNILSPLFEEVTTAIYHEIDNKPFITMNFLTFRKQ